MWRSERRIDRLSKALEFRGINPKNFDIYDLEKTLIRRGIIDAKLSNVCDILLKYLEPKRCQMHHCESHGVDGFCNCCDNIVPAKCKKHRDFLKRCKAKAIKSTDWLLEIKESRYSNLSINCDIGSYYFFADLEEIPGFELVEKWSSRLKSDVWKEVKRRAKKEDKNA